MEGSWQVTGSRQNASANAHRIPVEEEKPELERGFYHLRLAGGLDFLLLAQRPTALGAER
jgi:hypothetical protein